MISKAPLFIIELLRHRRPISLSPVIFKQIQNDVTLEFSIKIKGSTTF